MAPYTNASWQFEPTARSNMTEDNRHKREHQTGQLVAVLVACVLIVAIVFGARCQAEIGKAKLAEDAIQQKAEELIREALKYEEDR